MIKKYIYNSINPEEYMVNIYHFLNTTKTLNSFKLKEIA